MMDGYISVYLAPQINLYNTCHVCLLLKYCIVMKYVELIEGHVRETSQRTLLTVASCCNERVNSVQ